MPKPVACQSFLSWTRRHDKTYNCILTQYIEDDKENEKDNNNNKEDKWLLISIFCTRSRDTYVISRSAISRLPGRRCMDRGPERQRSVLAVSPVRDSSATRVEGQHRPVWGLRLYQLWVAHHRPPTGEQGQQPYQKQQHPYVPCGTERRRSAA